LKIPFIQDLRKPLDPPTLEKKIFLWLIRLLMYVLFAYVYFEFSFTQL